MRMTMFILLSLILTSPLGVCASTNTLSAPGVEAAKAASAGYHSSESSGGAHDLAVAERSLNSVLDGVIVASMEHIGKGDYDGVHRATAAALYFTDGALKKNPLVQISAEKMSDILFMDADAYGAQRKFGDAARSYEASLKYRARAQGYFRLGYVQYMSGEKESGRKNFRLAVSLDRTLDPECAKVMKTIQKQ